MRVVFQQRTFLLGRFFAFAILCFNVQSQLFAATTIPTISAQYETVAEQRIFDATVEAVNKSTISAQVSDRIVKVNFDVNDYVAKGAVLLHFSDKPQRAQMQQAQASLKEAQVRLKDAQIEFDRVSEIYAKKLVAKAALDSATTNLNTAKAKREQSSARVSQAKEQLERTIVRAPYSGIVTKRHVEVGETPRLGQALLTGLSLAALRVSAEIPQQFVSVLRDECCPAHILLPSKKGVSQIKKSVLATGITIFPIADPISHSFKIRVDLEPGEYGLYPGMFVKLVLDVATQQRMLIPQQAIVKRSEVTGVYISGNDQTFSFRHIRIGKSHDDGRVEVHAGIEVGEKVALDPIAAGINLKQQVKSNE